MSELGGIAASRKARVIIASQVSRILSNNYYLDPGGKANTLFRMAVLRINRVINIFPCIPSVHDWDSKHVRCSRGIVMNLQPERNESEVLRITSEPRESVLILRFTVSRHTCQKSRCCKELRWSLVSLVAFQTCDMSAKTDAACSVILHNSASRKRLSEMNSTHVNVSIDSSVFLKAMMTQLTTILIIT